MRLGVVIADLFGVGRADVDGVLINDLGVGTAGVINGEFEVKIKI